MLIHKAKARKHLLQCEALTFFFKKNPSNTGLLARIVPYKSTVKDLKTQSHRQCSGHFYAHTICACVACKPNVPYTSSTLRTGCFLLCRRWPLTAWHVMCAGLSVATERTRRSRLHVTRHPLATHTACWLTERSQRAWVATRANSDDSQGCRYECRVITVQL